MDIFEVKISKKAEKDLINIPTHISFKLQIWIDSVKCENAPAFMMNRWKENAKGNDQLG